MNDKLISIIVPVYNVKQYLSKCIDSIIDQTYKNIEILLIDDGSIDTSERICDEYAKKDDRIIVIHKENGGLSSARNVGLDKANGELVCFVDSDDYLEPDMIEKLKHNMKKFDSDISVCNFYNEKKGVSKVKLIKDSSIEFVCSEKEKFINMQNKYNPLMCYAWNKLYKKELFNQVRFPKDKLYEYNYIVCDIFDKAKKVSYILEPLYHYVYRNMSIGHSFNLKHFDKIDSFDKKIYFFNQKGYNDLLLKEKSRKSASIIVNLANMKANKLFDPLIYNKYYQELIKISKELSWKEVGKKTKFFKVFRRCYIEWLYIEYSVHNIIKRIRSKQKQ